MDTAIIICTHGSTAESLVKTIEMLLGKQKNICWINFLSEDNTQILKEKYIKHIENLKTNKNILFLVDMWGGTPFNVAHQIIANKKNYTIITGVNIPMLTEICMSLNDNLTIQELINVAIQSGRNGIKNTYNKYLNDLKILNKNTNNIQSYPSNNTKHMKINLVRIDDRLIHGQIVTRWTKEIDITRIIIISDEVASDEMRKQLLIQVSPPGIKAHVINISKAIRVYNNPKYAKDRVMLLFNNPYDIIPLIESGIPITSINIGGMAFSQGKIQIHNAVSVNTKDIEAFKKLNTYGVNLEIRKIISDTPLNIMDLINKLNIE